MIILSSESGLEHMEVLMGIDLEELYIRTRAKLREAQVFTRELLMAEIGFLVRNEPCAQDRAEQTFELLWKENAIETAAPGTWRFTDLFDARMDRVKARWQVRYALQQLMTDIVDHEGAFGMRLEGSEISWEAGCSDGDSAYPKGGIGVTKLTDEQVTQELEAISAYLRREWKMPPRRDESTPVAP